MRIAIVVLIWILLVGGLFFYVHFRGSSKSEVQYDKLPSEGNYKLEINSSTTLEPDPYSLTEKSDNIESLRTSLLIRLNGGEIFRSMEKITFETPIIIDPVQGIKIGLNELYIEAYPPVESPQKENAIRIILLKGNRKIAERTFWSRGGEKIGSAFIIDIKE